MASTKQSAQQLACDDWNLKHKPGLHVTYKLGAEGHEFHGITDGRAYVAILADGSEAAKVHVDHGRTAVPLEFVRPRFKQRQKTEDFPGGEIAFRLSQTEHDYDQLSIVCQFGPSVDPASLTKQIKRLVSTELQRWSNS